jgi:solute carrier family 34 (sodium-dependent phosphate cotransporter)
VIVFKNKNSFLVVKVNAAIPMILGANIGTSVTSVIVSLTNVVSFIYYYKLKIKANCFFYLKTLKMNTERFRLSFAGATVHDIFNLSSVLILLPIEMAFGYLEVTSRAIVNSFDLYNRTDGSNLAFLNALTEPLTHAIILIDKDVISNIAVGDNSTSLDNSTLIQHFCPEKVLVSINGTEVIETVSKPCKFLFQGVYWPEWTVGLLILVVSLLVMCFSLICIVKILSALLKGSLAGIIKKFVNADFPGPFKFVTGYIAIIVVDNEKKYFKLHLLTIHYLLFF